MRILQGVFLGITVLYVYVAETLAPQNGAQAPAPFVLSICATAAVVAVLAYLIRRVKLYPALEKLSNNPDDPEALKSWRTIILMSLAFGEAMALFGLVLRIMGASRLVSWPFFLVALILMVIWGPRLSVDSEVPGTKTSQ